MEKQLADFAREKIKEGLSKLTEAHRIKFKHIYSENWRKLTVDEVLNNIPDDKLDHALRIVNRTLEINKEFRKEET